VALRLIWPADCEECSAEPEALVLWGAFALSLLVLVATVLVSLLRVWRWLRASRGGDALPHTGDVGQTRAPVGYGASV
jgi:hypothetical protein